MGGLSADFFVKLLFQSVSGPGALPPLSVSGPRALCVGFRHSLALCVRPALSVSGCAGTGALCVEPRRSLCRALRPAPALFSAVWVGARRSLRRVPAPSRGALSFSVSGSVSGPRHSPATLCIGPALSASPSALCVGSRRSRPFCGDPLPALSATGPAALCIGAVPALSVSGPALSVSGPSFSASLSAALSVSTLHLLDAPGPPAPPPSGLPPAPILATQPLRGTAQIRVPPIQPGEFPFSRREPQTLLFGGKRSS